MNILRITLAYFYKEFDPFTSFCSENISWNMKGNFYGRGSAGSWEWVMGVMGSSVLRVWNWLNWNSWVCLQLTHAGKSRSSSTSIQQKHTTLIYYAFQDFWWYFYCQVQFKSLFMICWFSAMAHLYSTVMSESNLCGSDASVTTWYTRCLHGLSWGIAKTPESCFIANINPGYWCGRFWVAQEKSITTTKS